MKTRFDIRRYRETHGCAPSGVGVWVFRAEPGCISRRVQLTHYGRYGDGKRRASEWMHGKVVEVVP